MNFFPYESGGVLAAAIAIALGAFVSEDGATVAAATLAASSVLDVRLAFLSAFAGLWIGDLSVYAVARWTGPAIRQHRWLGPLFAKTPSNDAPPNRKKMQWNLALSRFLPGTRLPEYIAAGFGRMNVGTFAAVTAISAIA